MVFITGALNPALRLASVPGQKKANRGRFASPARAWRPLACADVPPRSAASQSSKRFLADEFRQSHYLFTSESVSEGHPDKVADRISDTVVDAFLAADPYARVACETMVTTNRIILAGEVRGPDGVIESLEEKARAAVRDIGYEQEGFHWDQADFACHLHSQSADIAMGVDAAGNKDEGAGDQGIMFGYATNETPELMPATLQYSHNILKTLAAARQADAALGLEPDAKSQVTLEYQNGKPVRADSIVLSTQHREGLSPPTSPRSSSPTS